MQQIKSLEVKKEKEASAVEPEKRNKSIKNEKMKKKSAASYISLCKYHCFS